MAVLIEGFNIVVRNESVIKNFQGGLAEFRSSLPNSTYCTDDTLHRLGFMEVQKLEDYGNYLMSKGLIQDEIIVVDMLNGILSECDWLKFSRNRWFKDWKEYKNSDKLFSIAWHKPPIPVYGLPVNEKLELEIAYPPYWNPDKALLQENFKMEF
jgi:hypothetical protein